MRQHDIDPERTVAETNASAARGHKAFAVVDFAITVAKVSIVVIGLMLLAITLSGADMARLDEHEVFRYRMVAAPAIIIGYLLIDYLLARRRADRSGAAANDADQARPNRSWTVEFMALAFVAAGGAAFWHDLRSNEIPNAVATPATFVSAQCVERSGRKIVVGPHMSIGYEFVSRSTSVRESGVKCLLDNCEPEKRPSQYMDTEYNRVFYASLSQCQAALPAVLAARAPTTVWTGDKDPNASVRARFTPERAPPSYFLLWVPLSVSALVLLVFGWLRTRDSRRAGP